MSMTKEEFIAAVIAADANDGQYAMAHVFATYIDDRATAAVQEAMQSQAPSPAAPDTGLLATVKQAMYLATLAIGERRYLDAIKGLEDAIDRIEAAEGKAGE